MHWHSHFGVSQCPGFIADKHWNSGQEFPEIRFSTAGKHRTERPGGVCHYIDTVPHRAAMEYHRGIGRNSIHDRSGRGCDFIQFVGGWWIYRAFSEYNSVTAPATRMTRAKSADIQIINVLLFISPTHFCGKVRQYGVKPIKYKDTQYFT